MNDKRKIMRRLSEIFGVGESDIPKTLQRFKDEVDEMEKELKK
jgi:hypothetical protein